MERLTFTDEPALKPWVTKSEALKRLAAYEDTNWEPEVVEAVKKEFAGIPIDHLRKLVQAEADGRLVVLPEHERTWQDHFKNRFERIE